MGVFHLWSSQFWWHGTQCQSRIQEIGLDDHVQPNTISPIARQLNGYCRLSFSLLRFSIMCTRGSLSSLNHPANPQLLFEVAIDHALCDSSVLQEWIGLWTLSSLSVSEHFILLLINFFYHVTRIYHFLSLINTVYYYITGIGFIHYTVLEYRSVSRRQIISWD